MIRARKKRNNTLVFLHGFFGSPKDWQDVVEICSKHYICICPDLTNPGWRYELPSRFGLIGYSMGGRIALPMLFDDNLNIFGAVIASASLGLKSNAERETRLKADLEVAQRLRTEPIHSLLQEWYAKDLFKSFRNSRAFVKVLERRQAIDPIVWAQILEDTSVAKQPNYEEKLKDCKVPYLLVYGELDDKYVTNAPKGSRLIKDAGHAIHLEQPRILAQEIIQFFDGVFACQQLIGK